MAFWWVPRLVRPSWASPSTTITIRARSTCTGLLEPVSQITFSRSCSFFVRPWNQIWYKILIMLHNVHNDKVHNVNSDRSDWRNFFLFFSWLLSCFLSFVLFFLIAFLVGQKCVFLFSYFLVFFYKFPPQDTCVNLLDFLTSKLSSFVGKRIKSYKKDRLYESRRNKRWRAKRKCN